MVSHFCWHLLLPHGWKGIVNKWRLNCVFSTSFSILLNGKRRIKKFCCQDQDQRWPAADIRPFKFGSFINTNVLLVWILLIYWKLCARIYMILVKFQSRRTSLPWVGSPFEFQMFGIRLNRFRLMNIPKMGNSLRCRLILGRWKRHIKVYTWSLWQMMDYILQSYYKKLQFCFLKILVKIALLFAAQGL